MTDLRTFIQEVTESQTATLMLGRGPVVGWARLSWSAKSVPGSWLVQGRLGDGVEGPRFESWWCHYR